MEFVSSIFYQFVNFDEDWIKMKIPVEIKPPLSSILNLQHGNVNKKVVRLS